MAGGAIRNDFIRRVGTGLAAAATNVIGDTGDPKLGR